VGNYLILQSTDKYAQYCAMNQCSACSRWHD